MIQNLPKHILFFSVFFIVGLLITPSCKTILPEPSGLYNYGFINTNIEDSLKYKISLPGGFNFSKVKLSSIECELLFEPHQFLFAANQTILAKYKTIALQYSYSNLNEFSNIIISHLKKVSKLDSLYQVRGNYTKNFVYKNSHFLLNDSIPFNVYEYIIKGSKHSKLHVIEQHVINTVTHKAIRFIWIANFDNSLKDNYAKESLEQLSADALHSVTFSIPTTNPFWLATSNFNYENGYNYCLPSNLINDIKNSFEKAPFQVRSGYLQASTTYASMAGDFKAARFFDSKVFKFRSDSEDVKRISACDTINASAYILRIAREKKVIMFNEAHHWPQCRAFLRDMLTDFKAIGYNKLALEALTNDPKILGDIQYPKQSVGLYTSEPIYGQLIREARRLGFTIIAYEDTVECKSNDYKVCINQREQNEAQNIFNVLQKDKDKGKLIVLAGYDHIKKKQTSDRTPMAVYLMKLLDTTPACFDLTKYYEKETKEIQSKVYNIVIDKFNPMVPVILKDKNNIPFVNKEDQDMIDANVFLPKGEIDKLEFPRWYKSKNASEIVLKFKNKIKKKLFLQIFLKKERQDFSWEAEPYLNHFLVKGINAVTVPLVLGTEYNYVLKDPLNNKTIEYGLVKF